MAESESANKEARAREAVLNTKLFLHLKKDQWPIVYHSIYNISFLGLQRLHPFDAGKWGKIHTFLKENGMFKGKKSTVEPLEASESDLLVVHTQRYLDSLKGLHTN